MRHCTRCKKPTRVFYSHISGPICRKCLLADSEHRACANCDKPMRKLYVIYDVDDTYDHNPVYCKKCILKETRITNLADLEIEFDCHTEFETAYK